MKNTYTTERIEKFPIEKSLDKEENIKLYIDIEGRKISGYLQFSEDINEKFLSNICSLTNGEFDKKNNRINIKFISPKNQENIQIFSINKLGDIQVDLKNNTISSLKIPTRTKMYMSQKNGVELPKQQYFEEEGTKIKSDLHSHYTAMLEPEKLLALGLKHNINYNVFYIYALDLELSKNQQIKINQMIRDRFEDKEKADKLLQLLKENKGNYKVIEEIFNGNKDKGLPKMVIPLSNLIIGKYPKSKNGNVQKILKSCALPQEFQNEFTDMTDTYNNRFPFTNSDGEKFDIAKYKRAMESQNIPQNVKDILEKMCEDRENPNYSDNNLQDDQLLWIARDAQKDGIEYIEMSHNALSKKGFSKWIQTYDKMLDKIEKETGTRLRFLAGVSRTTKSEDFEKVEEYIKKALKNKYVVGFDVLGEELNPTKDFGKLLKNMTQYALEEDPDMVIRVHAGETNSFDSNVLNAVEIVYNEYCEKAKTMENPEDLAKPNLRIGHGIHGVEQELKPLPETSILKDIIPQLQEMGLYSKDKPVDEIRLVDFMSEMETVIIERCITSNASLSHENSPRKELLKLYMDLGIRCVIATDGKGVYRNELSRRIVSSSCLGN